MLSVAFARSKPWVVFLTHTSPLGFVLFIYLGVNLGNDGSSLGMLSVNPEPLWEIWSRAPERVIIIMF